jgi:hypothetical protein
MSQTSAPVRPRTAARVALVVVGAAAALLGLLVVVLLVRSATTLPTLDRLTVADLHLGNASTPAFLEGVDHVGRAWYSGVSLELVVPPQDVVRLALAVRVARSLGVVAVCAVLVLLCAVTLRGRPFARSAPVALITAGLLLVVSDVVADVLDGRLGSRVIALLGDGVTSGATDGGSYEGLAASTEILLSALGVGTLLCVLGVVFALGGRMQRDTERLV